MSEKSICPYCGKIATVGDCEPNIDGDGSPGCPKCLALWGKKVVMLEIKTQQVNITWKDPEGDINAAVLQIQEILQHHLDKDVN